jgi:hypothetical protein
MIISVTNKRLKGKMNLNHLFLINAPPINAIAPIAVKFGIGWLETTESQSLIGRNRVAPATTKIIRSKTIFF